MSGREDPKIRDEEMRERAKESFKNHRITQAQKYPMGARWLIQRPYSDGTGFDWTMAAEIVVMAGGRIVVWGDLYPVMFAHFGAFKDPRQVIDWMGGCTDLGYYVHQKATIGCREVVDVWEADVARFELSRAIDQRLEEARDRVESYEDPMLTVFDDAVSYCDDDDEEEGGEAGALRFLEKELTSLPTSMDPLRFLPRFTEAPKGTLKDVLEQVAKERAREVMRDHDPFISVVEEAIEHYTEEGDQARMSHFLYERLGYDEAECLFGMGVVLSPRVYYAHAALARLSHLLDQEESEPCRNL